MTRVALARDDGHFVGGRVKLIDTTTDEVAWTRDVIHGDRMSGVSGWVAMSDVARDVVHLGAAHAERVVGVTSRIDVLFVFHSTKIEGCILYWLRCFFITYSSATCFR